MARIHVWHKLNFINEYVDDVCVWWKSTQRWNGQVGEKIAYSKKQKSSLYWKLQRNTLLRSRIIFLRWPEQVRLLLLWWCCWDDTIRWFITISLSPLNSPHCWLCVTEWLGSFFSIWIHNVTITFSSMFQLISFFVRINLLHFFEIYRLVCVCIQKLTLRQMAIKRGCLFLCLFRVNDK